MLTSLHLPLICSAAFVASASPGPATLAIADTSMKAGRKVGFALALGVATGSLAWSTTAALGLAAIMAASAWTLELMRYLGAGYLLFLAWKSARNATRGPGHVRTAVPDCSPARAYTRGLLLHLTNPKPVLFFGSLYTLGVSADTTLPELALIITILGVQSTLTFTAYAWLFSNVWVSRGYVRLRRWFDGAFALIFAAAGFKLLTARATS